MLAARWYASSGSDSMVVYWTFADFTNAYDHINLIRALQT